MKVLLGRHELSPNAIRLRPHAVILLLDGAVALIRGLDLLSRGVLVHRVLIDGDAEEARHGALRQVRRFLEHFHQLHRQLHHLQRLRLVVIVIVAVVALLHLRDQPCDLLDAVLHHNLQASLAADIRALEPLAVPTQVRLELLDLHLERLDLVADHLRLLPRLLQLAGVPDQVLPQRLALGDQVAPVVLDPRSVGRHVLNLLLLRFDLVGAGLHQLGLPSLVRLVEAAQVGLHPGARLLALLHLPIQRRRQRFLLLRQLIDLLLELVDLHLQVRHRRCVLLLQLGDLLGLDVLRHAARGARQQERAEDRHRPELPDHRLARLLGGLRRHVGDVLGDQLELRRLVREREVGVDLRLQRHRARERLRRERRERLVERDEVGERLGDRLLVEGLEDLALRLLGTGEDAHGCVCGA